MLHQASVQQQKPHRRIGNVCPPRPPLVKVAKRNAVAPLQKELKENERLKVNPPLQPRKMPFVRRKRRRRQRVAVQNGLLKRPLKTRQVRKLPAHRPQHYVHNDGAVRQIKLQKKVVFKHLQVLRRRTFLQKFRHKAVA